MYVIKAHNVNDALALGLEYLKRYGVPRDSRNGPVLLSPEPVTTVYEKPLERVLFWSERDANPFFHLYEAMWMLAGRNDVDSLVPYAKQMKEYSDDGRTFHGAYGYRWRKWFDFDQLTSIAESLKKNPDDRRQILQMWDPRTDLGKTGKDFPCNVSATFQINTNGVLDLCVFCRSNDIVWGAYGANAVHFSFLLEYMAHWIGVPVGRYSQISINWHGYLSTVNPLLEKISPIDPYAKGEVRPLLFPEGPVSDKGINQILSDQLSYNNEDEFWKTISTLIFAHRLWRMLAAPERYDRPLFMMKSLDPRIDFVRACSEWLLRRRERWEEKLQSKSKCTRCNGNGEISIAGGWAGYPDEPCPDCKGTGQQISK